MNPPHEPTGRVALEESGERATTELEPLDGAYSLVELEPGETVGRYTVERRVGAGAMGVVYEAHDPRLDRKVAIKVLRRRALDPHESALAEARLLREARALARLSHPNVVPVYDAGTATLGEEEFIFLAMEYVEGQTLRAWVKQQKDARKILAAMKQAGRGLAAAHAAGLVHRDFKLDNVIIDAGGRARVMDFGLARPQSEGDDDDEDDDLDSGGPLDSVSNLGATLTRAGTVMGTPVYMSPEQHVGRPLDARSDQFSFCVALYEALYGRRPFIGSSAKQLARAKLRGRIRRLPPGKPLADLVEVIERGLRPNPAMRWPSVPALLKRLKPKRRRSLVGVAVAVPVVGLIATLAILHSTDRNPCGDAEARLADVWPAEHRSAIREAWSGVKSDEIEGALDLVVTRLDAYAAAWLAAWEVTCRAGVNAGEDGGAAVDRQALCLDRRRAELATAVDVVGSLDEQNLARAPYTIAELTPPESCLLADASAPFGDDDEPEPGTLAADAHRLYRRAQVRARAGQYAVGLGEAFAALALASAAGHMPTILRAEVQIGTLLGDIGEFAGSERMLIAAVHRAESIQDDAMATSAASHLAYLVGVRLQRIEDGLRWARMARAFAERIPHDTWRLSHVLENEANILEDAGRRPEALAQMRRVLELREAAPPSHRGRLAMGLNNLGTMLMAQGDYAEAREVFDRSLAIRKEVLGPAHPDTAMSYINLGALEAKLQRYEQSIELCERGLQIYRASVGEVHPSVAAAVQIIAASKTYLGHYDDAARLHEQLIDMRVKLYGPDHVLVADAWGNLGGVFANEGRFEEAETAVAKAITIYGSTEADESELAGLHHNLATIALRQNRLDRAEEYFKSALELWERDVGSEHSDISFPLAGLGQVMLQRGQPRAARPYLERAQRLTTELERSPRVALIEFWLAQSLWPDVDQRAHAWQLIERARHELAGAPPFYAEDHEELMAWVEAHGAELPVVAGD